MAGLYGGTDPVGITVAIPGLVETDPGVLTFAPNLGWRDLPLVSELSGRLGNPPYLIRMDNDANLSAIGEWAFGVAAGTADLVYLTTPATPIKVPSGSLKCPTTRPFGDVAGPMTRDPPSSSARCNAASTFGTPT